MTKQETQLQQMLAGTQKNIPVTSTVDVNGTKMQQPDIVAKLQGWISVMEQKEAAKAPYNTAVLAVQAVASDARQFRVSFGQALKQVFGKNNPLLAEFGLSTVQRKEPTTKTRILAQAKTAATRKARGTLSKQQKLAIKGPDVTSVIVASNGPNVVVPPVSQDGAVADAPGAVAPEPAAGPAPNPNAGK